MKKSGDKIKKKIKKFLKKYSLSIFILVVLIISAALAFHAIRSFILRETLSRLHIYDRVGELASNVRTNRGDKNVVRKFLARRLQEMRNVNESHMSDFNKLLELWDEQENKRQEQEQENLTQIQLQIAQEIDKKLQAMAEAENKKQLMQDEKRKQEQDSFAKKYLELIEARLTDTQEHIQRHVGEKIENTFKVIALEVSQREREKEFALKKERDAIAKKQLALFEKKLSSTFDQVTKQINDNFTKLVVEGSQKREKFRESLTKEQKKLHTTLVKKQDTFEKELKKEQLQSFEVLAKAKAEDQRRRLEVVAKNLLKAIEKRLSATSINIKQENNGEDERLVEKLRGASKKDPIQLRNLDKKLAKKQQENMIAKKSLGKKGEEITQKEVDALVKKEVQKQLSSLKFRRDPRIARLKKVVALEKMRRLVKGLADGDTYEGAFAF